MQTHFDTDRFEHFVGEASHLMRCAGDFARRGRVLRAAGAAGLGAAERQRAQVYRHKAGKALNAARRFLPH